MAEWQTRKFQMLVSNIVWVQIPFLAPAQALGGHRSVLLIIKMYQTPPAQALGDYRSVLLIIKLYQTPPAQVLDNYRPVKQKFSTKKVEIFYIIFTTITVMSSTA